jgi:allantoate deiminase
MQPLSHDHPAVIRTWDRLQSLGSISDEPGRLTRTFLSQGSRRAAGQILAWMREAGLEVEHDALGNLRGRHHCPGAAGPPLVLGSHYDTVPDAGRYDGALGVLTAIAALAHLRDSGNPPQRPVDVLAFADEEGVRFHATYLGSRACTGTLDDALLGIRDACGGSIAGAIAAEGWHDGAQPIHYRRGDAAAYLEVHIEQGRVLEDAGQPLGVVPAICGQTRARATLRGRTEHAGTTPMPMRRDALAAAAGCILAIESIARQQAPLVATVGRIDVLPGAGNSIPGEACFTIDVRHPQDEARRTAVLEIQHACEAVARSRDVDFTCEVVQQTPAVSCDPAWTARWVSAIGSHGGTPPPAVCSGAGHDAVVFSEIAPVAMLFVRCRGGLSHHPDEHISREDLAAAISATAACLHAWSRETPSPP